MFAVKAFAKEAAYSQEKGKVLQTIFINIFLKINNLHYFYLKNKNKKFI